MGHKTANRRRKAKGEDIAMRNILMLLLLSFLGVVKGQEQDYMFSKKDFINEKVYYKKSAIPCFIKQKIKQANSGKIRLANPGKKYRSTDVVNNPLLPSRRLIFFIKTDKLNVLYYEHGGRGKHEHCIVLVKDSISGKFNYPVSLVIKQGILSPEELKKHLIEGRYSELKNHSCKF
jgi:hypothetical protein